LVKAGGADDVLFGSPVVAKPKSQFSISGTNLLK
jgi:hypothetical protein